ncbi:MULTISPECIES: hypothetical protein [Bacillus]|uniref:DUF3953 domain-containing protein n=5 Tax=Bacillus TaxID=1386 RepID=A0A9X6TY16_BACTU|nr:MULTISPECIES: hypothetical protein [Bacillus]KAA0784773.1 hypothetical protein DN393_21750 [Bacillus sp. BPN334]MBJ3788391.1 hypothetical protein [Bacillus sp. OA1]MDJ0281991.1 hypothetical protein [Bacillus bombysepticus]NIE93008.1 hypothetical protein [Bacillus sp. Ab-1751]AQY42719.1 hypothetical protein B4918_31660 [Bacillus thuringiensis]
MEMSKGILFYRLTLIIACFAVVAFTYPSEFSKFALIAGIVGIFITLDKIIAKDNKKRVYLLVSLLFLIGFAITFYYTFL